jgi:hypothetical protein
MSERIDIGSEPPDRGSRTVGKRCRERQCGRFDRGALLVPG